MIASFVKATLNPHVPRMFSLDRISNPTIATFSCTVLSLCSFHVTSIPFQLISILIPYTIYQPSIIANLFSPIISPLSSIYAYHTPNINYQIQCSQGYKGQINKTTMQTKGCKCCHVSPLSTCCCFPYPSLCQYIYI